MFDSGSTDEVALEVDGMSCGHCRQAVEDALGEVDGVASVEVSLDDGRADVTVDEGTDAASLTAAVEDAGYEARLQ